MQGQKSSKFPQLRNTAECIQVSPMNGQCERHSTNLQRQQLECGKDEAAATCTDVINAKGVILLLSDPSALEV